MSDKLIDWEYDLTFQKLGGSTDDVMYIAGEASNPAKDEDGENMDMSSLKSAFVDYMKNPVIKFMHDKAPQHMGAIGVVVEKYTDGEGKIWETKFGKTPFLVAKFEKGTLPDWMWNAIQKRVYKGLSIGGKALKKINGTIFVKSWLETSVVDVPSAKGSFFSILKMACSGDNCPHKGGEDLDKIADIPTESLGRINMTETPIRSTEPDQEQSEKSKKMDTWYNLKELKGFIEEFPKASITDMSEKVGFDEEYIKQLLEKLDNITKTLIPLKTPGLDGYLKNADSLKTPSIDTFLKGGPGSGVKGHTTAKQEQAKKAQSKLSGIIDSIKEKYGDDALYMAQETQEVTEVYGEKVRDAVVRALKSQKKAPGKVDAKTKEVVDWAKKKYGEKALYMARETHEVSEVYGDKVRDDVVRALENQDKTDKSSLGKKDPKLAREVSDVLDDIGDIATDFSSEEHDFAGDDFIERVDDTKGRLNELMDEAKDSPGDKKRQTEIKSLVKELQAEVSDFHSEFSRTPNIDTFLKGGPGSGVKGHRTSREKTSLRGLTSEQKRLEIEVKTLATTSSYGAEGYKRLKEEHRKAIAEYRTVSRMRDTKLKEEHPEQWKKEQTKRRDYESSEGIEAMSIGPGDITIQGFLKGCSGSEQRSYKTPAIDALIEKGGPGSGVKGHTTAKQEGPSRPEAKDEGIPKKMHTKDMLGRAAVDVISSPDGLEEMLVFPPNHSFTDLEIKGMLRRDGISSVGNQIAVDYDTYDDVFGDKYPKISSPYTDEGKSTAPGEGAVAIEAKGISDDTSKLNMKDTVIFPQATRLDDATIKKAGKDMVNAEGHFAMSNDAYKTHFGDTDPLGILGKNK